MHDLERLAGITHLNGSNVKRHPRNSYAFFEAPKTLNHAGWRCKNDPDLALRFPLQDRRYRSIEVLSTRQCTFEDPHAFECRPPVAWNDLALDQLPHQLALVNSGWIVAVWKRKKDTPFHGRLARASNP
jgi:hypothetical protein